MSVHKPKKFREPQAAHKRSRSSYEQPHGCVNSRTLKTKGEGEGKSLESGREKMPTGDKDESRGTPPRDEGSPKARGRR